MREREDRGLKPFNVADYLTTSGRVREYLRAAFAEDDTEFTKEAFKTVAGLLLPLREKEGARASPEAWEG